LANYNLTMDRSCLIFKGCDSLGEILKGWANFMNDLHDFIVEFFKIMDIQVSDKDLHFWLIGVIGMILFFGVNALFVRISRRSITVISFLYTFTVLVVLVFGLEIQQKITGRGDMEFADVVAGLWGFLTLFGGLLAAKLFIYLVGRLRGK